MNDMNFFAPFQSTKQKGRKGSVMKGLLVLMGALLVAAPVAGFAYEFTLNRSIADIQAQINGPENAATLKALDEKQARLAQISQALPDLTQKDQQLSSAEWLTEDTLRVINDTIPKQVYINMMTLNNREIQLSGTSTDKPAISELEYALRQSGISDNLLVSNIIKDEIGTYKFTINFTAKDVKPQ